MDMSAIIFPNFIMQGINPSHLNPSHYEVWENTGWNISWDLNWPGQLKLPSQIVSLFQQPSATSHHHFQSLITMSLSRL
jgi:hypothetical protein